MASDTVANPLKASVKLIPTLLFVLALAACGGGSMSTPPPPATPTITSFTPASGIVGASVTIAGTNFTGATSVSFNGTGAAFTVASATQITTTVPAAATTGKVSVTTAGGTATSASSFTVTASAPTISSFTPASAAVGGAVTISGTNFTGATAVSFNGTAATFSVASATQITTTVPTGATSGTISVTTPGGTATSASSFTVTVTPPTISGFAPTAGPVNTPVTITGTNFTGATAVKFNNTSATFTVTSATQITTAVPTGATTGKISVTTAGGTATTAGNFTVNTSSTTLDLTIDGLYITQATQDYPTPSVPLVKDRSAWVRVFVKANQTNTVAPQVRVDFVNGTTTNSLTINSPSASVPTSIDPNTNASWNAAVSSAWILAGTQVVATVDPSGSIPEADKTNNTFSANLDVRTLHPWKITLVPVHTKDGLTGTVTSATRTSASWLDFAKRLHPVPDALDIVVGATMNSNAASLSSDGTNWSTVLNELDAKRTADGITDRYYFGVVNVSYTSGVAGLGFIGWPVAMGWDVASSYPSVLAHEEGHNFGRQHAPCGSPSNPDPNYPYSGGIIGVAGWDVFAASNNFKNANTYTDVMGYCGTQWISDYNYSGELSFRAANSFAIVGTGASGGPTEGLLIWGRIDNGAMTLEPAFRVPFKSTSRAPGPYTLEARDAMGTVLASLPFDAHEVADLPNGGPRIFSFVVPLTPQALSAVAGLRIVRAEDGAELARRVSPAAALPFTLAQPATPTTAVPAEAVQVQDLSDGSAQFTWDAVSSPVIMVRDTATGEVRGFLRGGSARLEDAPVDLEVQSSDGVRAQPQRHQRAIE